MPPITRHLRRTIAHMAVSKPMFLFENVVLVTRFWAGGCHLGTKSPNYGNQPFGFRTYASAAIPDSMAECELVTLWPSRPVHEWSINMRFTTTLAAATAIAVSAVAANAGGLADEIVEAPVVVAEPEPAPTSSVSPTYIVLGVLAALLIAAAVNADDDDDAEEATEDEADPELQLTLFSKGRLSPAFFDFRSLTYKFRQQQQLRLAQRYSANSGFHQTIGPASSFLVNVWYVKGSSYAFPPCTIGVLICALLQLLPLQLPLQSLPLLPMLAAWPMKSSKPLSSQQSLHRLPHHLSAQLTSFWVCLPRC